MFVNTIIRQTLYTTSITAGLSFQRNVIRLGMFMHVRRGSFLIDAGNVCFS